MAPVRARALICCRRLDSHGVLPRLFRPFGLLRPGPGRPAATMHDDGTDGCIRSASPFFSHLVSREPKALVFVTTLSSEYPPA
jgi:hypothetical protein